MIPSAGDASDGLVSLGTLPILSRTLQLVLPICKSGYFFNPNAEPQDAKTLWPDNPEEGQPNT
jgi:hypothetical protein